jgi:hypothetical protein
VVAGATRVGLERVIRPTKRRSGRFRGPRDGAL